MAYSSDETYRYHFWNLISGPVSFATEKHHSAKECAHTDLALNACDFFLDNMRHLSGADEKLQLGREHPLSARVGPRGIYHLGDGAS